MIGTPAGASLADLAALPARPTESPFDEARAQAALTALLHDVQQQPWAHDFFALLRRIDALRPRQPRTGQAQRPGQELLRLAQQPELDFAPAPLANLTPRDGLGLPPRLAVRFFGLLGPHGPMPLHLTEYVRERLHHHGDGSPAHFFDLFHHRLLSLFYRAWAQNQPVVQGDRPADDRFLAWLLASAGLPAGTGRLAPRTLAFHAGLLAGRSRHPEALCKVLRHQLGMPVAVQAHVGHWLGIEPDERSRLGHARNRMERATLPAAQLGHAANAGSRVWDRQSRFRLHLGPLTLAQHDALLPGGRAWAMLGDWLPLLAGPAQRWELALHLAPLSRPAPVLGQRPRLGVATWLGRRPGPEATTAAGAPGPAVAESTTTRADPRQRAAQRSAQGLRLRPGQSFLQRRAGA